MTRYACRKCGAELLLKETETACPYCAAVVGVDVLLSHVEAEAELKALLARLTR